MRLLYSVLFWSAFFLSTAVWATLVTLLAVVAWPFDRTLRLSQYAATIWGSSAFWLNPRWRCTVRGRERLAGGPYVICANHQSQVDILALSNLHGSWRFVSKREIVFIPFLGWAMKAQGTPFVRRGDKKSGQRVLEECRRWLDKGVSVILFPEGTRSPDGLLGTFKPGAFKLALESGRKVLPIVVEGSRHALPKGGFDASGRANVVVSVLEPIDPAPYREGNNVEGLSSAVRDAIAAELDRLRAPR